MKGFRLVMVIFTGYLSLVFMEQEAISVYLKPLLVPALLILFLLNVKQKGNYKIIGALLLSTLGDILLIFDGKAFFILGLLSFLLAHLLYILIFRSQTKSIKRDAFTIQSSVVVIMYYGCFMCFLWPHLGAMRIPVLAYALVISVMLWMALQFLRSTSSYKWHIVLGAFFFVVSDSLLSIQLFYSSFDFSHFYVMLTYLFAQSFLVYGIIRIKNDGYK